MWRVASVVIMVVAVSGCSGGEMDTSEPWDLVWFSDSTGWGIAELWGERIEQELGVEVRVHDQSAGGLAAATVLDGSTKGIPVSPTAGDTCWGRGGARLRQPPSVRPYWR